MGTTSKGTRLPGATRRFLLAALEERPPASLVRWARLLALIDPAHQEPDREPPPATITSRAGRVDLLARRHAEGLRLWCKSDLWDLAMPWEWDPGKPGSRRRRRTGRPPRH